MLTLDESMYITEGSERKCYRHPEDDNKIIKIQYDNSFDRNQNEVDEFYYGQLKKKNVPYDHIPRFHGRVETNYGSGLVFTRIWSYKKEPDKTLEEAALEKKFTEKQEEDLILKLKKYLEDNAIVFADVVPSNIICQEYEKNKFKLVIVDGLGARRFNFKFWLQTHSKLFTQMRINKQWKKFIHRYNQTKNSINN